MSINRSHSISQEVVTKFFVGRKRSINFHAELIPGKLFQKYTNIIDRKFTSQLFSQNIFLKLIFLKLIFLKKNFNCDVADFLQITKLKFI